MCQDHLSHQLEVAECKREEYERKLEDEQYAWWPAIQLPACLLLSICPPSASPTRSTGLVALTRVRAHTPPLPPCACSAKREAAMPAIKEAQAHKDTLKATIAEKNKAQAVLRHETAELKAENTKCKEQLVRFSFSLSTARCCIPPACSCPQLHVDATPMPHHGPDFMPCQARRRRPTFRFPPTTRLGVLSFVWMLKATHARTHARTHPACACARLPGRWRSGWRLRRSGRNAKSWRP